MNVRRAARSAILTQILLLATVPALAQAAAAVSPTQAGFSPERLERLDSRMQSYVDEGQLAGIVTLISRGGRIVHLRTHGYQDLETRRPLEEDAIFRIYSMTKPVTGVAMMMLFEEGRFLLTDPVAKYIPEFADLKVAAGEDGEGGLVLEDAVRPMTMRDLMTHTSGLTYGVFSRSAVDTLYQEAKLFDGTLEEMIAKLSRIPLRQQPGTVFHYSVSVDVQGHLVEKLSGLTLDQFFRERIFEPLGMSDTGFHVPAEKLDRLTTVYGPPEEGQTGLRVRDHPADTTYARPPGFLSGGAGLVSTARDYWRFCQMLLNEGELDGVRLLSPASVRLMRGNHLSEEVRSRSNQPGLGFGLNFAVVLDPAAAGQLGSPGEYYWGGYASTLFWIDPREEVIGILMTQFIPSGTHPLRPQMRNLVYQALVDEARPSRP